MKAVLAVAHQGRRIKRVAGIWDRVPEVISCPHFRSPFDPEDLFNERGAAYDMLNVSTCQGCGALVAEDAQDSHVKFHSWLEELQAALKKANIKVPPPRNYDNASGFENMLATVRDLPERKT